MGAGAVAPKVGGAAAPVKLKVGLGASPPDPKVNTPAGLGTGAAAVLALKLNTPLLCVVAIAALAKALPAAGVCPKEALLLPKVLLGFENAFAGVFPVGPPLKLKLLLPKIFDWKVFGLASKGDAAAVLFEAAGAPNTELPGFVVVLPNAELVALNAFAAG